MGTHGMDSERFETVVVGGGQAGLAAGYHLARRGRPFRDPRRRPARGRPLARALGLAAPVHPGRLQRSAGHGLPTAAWHATHQGRGGRLPGDLRGPVPAAGPAGGGRGRAHPAGRTVPGDRGERRFEADNLVVASGACHTPRVPAFAAELDPAILQLHSAAWHPSQLREGPTLVVGAGNSGAEIALELAGTRRTWLSGRHPGSEPTSAGSRLDRLFTRRSGSSSPGC